MAGDHWHTGRAEVGNPVGKGHRNGHAAAVEGSRPSDGEEVTCSVHDRRSMDEEDCVHGNRSRHDGGCRSHEAVRGDRTHHTEEVGHGGRLETENDL